MISWSWICHLPMALAPYPILGMREGLKPLCLKGTHFTNADVTVAGLKPPSKD